jgi:predicted O-methyltransferase YrrM
MFPGELEKLVAIVRITEQPKVMVEIGCHEGRTAAACLREILSLERYIGIEAEPSYRPGLEVQRRETPGRPGHYALADPRFNLMIRPRGSLDIAPADIVAADVVFIDGDHSAEAVLHDTALARAIVQTGGVVIWHDYGNPNAQVTRVLDDDVRRGYDISHIEMTWLAFERIGV